MGTDPGGSGRWGLGQFVMVVGKLTMLSIVSVVIQGAWYGLLRYRLLLGQLWELAGRRGQTLVAASRCAFRAWGVRVGVRVGVGSVGEGTKFGVVLVLSEAVLVLENCWGVL